MREWDEMEQLNLGLPALRRAFPDMLCNPEEAAVARALRWGRENARRIDDIAAEAELPARRVQDVIHHLLLEHHMPVGTAMAEPFGNYLIDNDDELAETVRLLRGRGLSNLQRAAALKRMTLRAFVQQLELEGL
jgi:hypothetical protein